MTQTIEKELKTSLTLEHYLLLKQLFKVSEKQLLIQENYYFDTRSNSLKALGIGLRFRFENKKCELTMKINHKQNEKIEITDTLTVQEGLHYLKSSTFPKNDVYKKLQALNIDTNQLILIGQLKNERYEIKHTGGVFALDKSYFKNGMTYELEFEYDDNPQIFFDFLNKYNLPYQPLPSKLERALQ